MNPPIPPQIGPVHLEQIGRLVLARGPRDLAPLFERAGGQFDRAVPGWWIEKRRIGPLIRALEKRVDPLFRAVGLALPD